MSAVMVGFACQAAGGPRPVSRGRNVGAALAGTAWLCAFTVVAAVARASRPAAADLTTFALAMSLATLMIVIVLGALPPVRTRVHNVFELTYRFGGWISVGLFWALTVHLMHADLGAWQIWLLALITAGTDPVRLFTLATRQSLADVKHRYDPADIVCASFPVTT